jgi:hypothetical protein
MGAYSITLGIAALIIGCIVFVGLAYTQELTVNTFRSLATDTITEQGYALSSGMVYASFFFVALFLIIYMYRSNQTSP